MGGGSAVADAPALCAALQNASPDAAVVAPFLGGVENGGGNDAADAPALCAALVKASP